MHHPSTSFTSHPGLFPLPTLEPLIPRYFLHWIVSSNRDSTTIQSVQSTSRHPTCPFPPWHLSSSPLESLPTTGALTSVSPPPISSHPLTNYLRTVSKFPGKNVAPAKPKTPLASPNSRKITQRGWHGSRTKTNSGVPVVVVVVVKRTS